MIEVSFKAQKNKKDVSLIEIALTAHGVSPTEFVYKDPVRGAKQLCVYLKNKKVFQGLKDFFHARGLSAWISGARELQKKDWLTKWQSDYRMGPLGKKFTIVPLWQKDRFKGSNIPVYMDPQGSFGSGTHETTRLVVQTMEKLEGQFKDFLDIGTGTGVLMIAAHHLGAIHNHGYDLDPQAVATAKINLKHNRVQNARVNVANVLKDRSKKQYDVVTANLLSKTLVDSRQRLADCVKMGGHLIVSGIERRSLPWFLRNFKVRSLRRIKATQSKSWASILYQRQ